MCNLVVRICNENEKYKSLKNQGWYRVIKKNQDGVNQTHRYVATHNKGTCPQRRRLPQRVAQKLSDRTLIKIILNSISSKFQFKSASFSGFDNLFISHHLDVYITYNGRCLQADLLCRLCCSKLCRLACSKKFVSTLWPTLRNGHIKKSNPSNF